jgi:hypothetical protein
LQTVYSMLKILLNDHWKNNFSYIIFQSIKILKEIQKVKIITYELLTTQLPQQKGVIAQ